MHSIMNKLSVLALLCTVTLATPIKTVVGRNVNAHAYDGCVAKMLSHDRPDLIEVKCGEKPDVRRREEPSPTCQAGPPFDVVLGGDNKASGGSAGMGASGLNVGEKAGNDAGENDLGLSEAARNGDGREKIGGGDSGVFSNGAVKAVDNGAITSDGQKGDEKANDQGKVAADVPLGKDCSCGN